MRRREIYRSKQVIEHEVSVASWRITGNANPFVEIERSNVTPVDPPGRGPSNELAIELDWRPSRRQSQSGLRPGGNKPLDDVGGGRGDSAAVATPPPPLPAPSPSPSSA